MHGNNVDGTKTNQALANSNNESTTESLPPPLPMAKKSAKIRSQRQMDVDIP